MSIVIEGTLIDAGICPAGTRRIEIETRDRYVEVHSLSELEVQTIDAIGGKVRITIERVDP